MKVSQRVGFLLVAVTLLASIALLSGCAEERITAGQFQLEPTQYHEGTLENGDYIYIAKEFRFRGARLDARPGEAYIFLAVDNPRLLVMSSGKKVGRAVWSGEAQVSGETHHALILALPRAIVESDNIQICYAK